VQVLGTVANHAGVALQNGELMEQLRHEALHDSLTGLPDRVFLRRSLGSVLDQVHGHQVHGRRRVRLTQSPYAISLRPTSEHAEYG
jgi:GGDEF domain-containing protein